jgi:hypothetical protein
MPKLLVTQAYLFGCAKKYKVRNNFGALPWFKDLVEGDSPSGRS